MKITVGIVTRNRCFLLKKVLSSLTEQTTRPFEVVVIDNGSRGKTKEIAYSFKKKLPIKYFLESQVGIPYARNKAIKEAKGDILAFIDDDMTVPKDWVKLLLSAHRANKSATAIQGYSINMPHTNSYLQITQYFQNAWLKENIDTTAKGFAALLDNRTKKTEIGTLVTRNCSLVLAKIKEINIEFDPLFLRGSDTDFGKRLTQQQNTIIFIPSIVAYHWEKYSLLGFIYKNFTRGKTRYSLHEKWGDMTIQFRNYITLHIGELFKIMYKKNIQENLGILRYTLLLYLYKLAFVSGYYYEKFRKGSKARTNSKNYHYCPICKTSIKNFVSKHDKTRKNVMCPYCGSRERYRVLTLFLEKKNFFKDKKSILEISPFPGFSKLLKGYKGLSYTSIDLLSNYADKKMDITNLQFSPESFDFIICSHVLEHVKKDTLALQQIHNVLQKNGICFIMVPLDKKRKKTFEEPLGENFSSEKREKLFGQKDHVRIYGKDFIERIKNQGFSVEVVAYAKEISSQEREKFGIKLSYATSLFTTSDDIYICKKITR